MEKDSISPLPTRESMTVEFKSDRKGLSDTEIVLAAVCLSNTRGGSIFIGIENDGNPTGATSQRQDVHRLAALIANSTTPALSVRVQVHSVGNVHVTEIVVPESLQPVGTRDGRYQRRMERADGTPECVGMLPHDLVGRLADLGQADFTAQPLKALDTSVLDASERERLKRLIRANNGDQSLLGLADTEFDGALGFTARVDGRQVPTLAGLLMLGHPEVLAEHVPTHEIAFQVLRGSDVIVNEFYRLPLGRVFEQLMDHLRTIVTEQEVMVDLFRVPVPSIERRAFREAVVNAMTHRDYARLGQIYVRLKDDELSVSSPGGFVRGVTLDNLLRVDPTPRNPRLADAFKRLGLSERTGRGVDIIYEGALRFGRPPPSYRRSTAELVAVVMDARPANLAFVEGIVEEERRTGSRLSLNALVVLGKLNSVKRAATAELGEALQDSDQNAVRVAVEQLVEAGLVQPHGTGKGRSYTMSARLYRKLGQAAEHVRQVGFDPEQQRQMVLTFVKEHGSIKRGDVVKLCGIGDDQAKRLLKRLVEEKLLNIKGAGRGVTYERPN